MHDQEMESVRNGGDCKSCDSRSSQAIDSLDVVIWVWLGRLDSHLVDALAVCWWPVGDAMQKGWLERLDLP